MNPLLSLAWIKQLQFLLVVLCRRAQLRHCLEQLKKQVPLSSDSMRNTTLNLLRRAQLHIKVDTTPWRQSQTNSCVVVFSPVSSSTQNNVTLLSCCCVFADSAWPCLKIQSLPFQKLQEQDELAEQLKGRLRWEQRELRVRLEQLQRGSERMRNNSQGSAMSSERSDSDRGRSLRHEKGLNSCRVTVMPIYC